MARKESVNPDMDLKSGSVPNPKPPKDVKSSSGRETINPDMDLKTEGVGSEANTGGVVNTRGREIINPDMELSQEGASGEGTAQEMSPATMPGVGNMPTGKKAASKSTQPE